jgi:hypothetical protein
MSSCIVILFFIQARSCRVRVGAWVMLRAMPHVQVTIWPAMANPMRFPPPPSCIHQAPGARGLLVGPGLLAVLPAHGRHATAKIGNANHPKKNQ